MSWIYQNIGLSISCMSQIKLLTLGFEGMDDLKVLPIEKSYACFVSEKPSVSLYFSKNNPKIWKKNLEEFVLNLNSVIFDKI